MTFQEFWTVDLWPLIWIVIKILCVVIPLMGAVAYISLYQRKIMAVMQLRKGPNVIGPWGLAQPLADGLKLIVKEWVIPAVADKPVFLIAPMLSFVLMLTAWAVIPFGAGLTVSNINLGVLFIFAISGLDVYGIVLAGWASNSRYAFLGGLRTTAQMISYEVSMGMIMASLLIFTGSLNLSMIVVTQQHIWFIIPFFPLAIMFFICILAETSRHPFDLPEAESELVAGYNVEYSGVLFALFQMGEYGNTILMSAVFATLFLGGWLPIFDIAPLNWIPGPLWLIAKTAVVVFVIYWLQATLPRFRYDQLMRLGWKVFLPLSLAIFIILAFIAHYNLNLVPHIMIG